MLPFLRLKSVGATLAWSVAAAWCLADPAPLEKRLLFGGDSAKSWSAAEATIEPSTKVLKITPASLHWHVTVDYQSGEVNYPVGWPRVNHATAEADRDWSDWEYLRMWIYVDTSREKLPREPVGLGLHTPDKASSFHRPLTELKKGQWTEICIPLAQLPECNDVRQIQFHIAESNYRHGDTLDVYIDDLSLVRHATPTLADFAAECAVTFSDVPSLPVHFQVLGVKRGAQAEVTCELRQGERSAAHGTWKVSRGSQRCTFDLGRERLTPGEYELVARISGNPQTATARMRVVESPWVETHKEVSR
jgi:hypothetical protein